MNITNAEREGLAEFYFAVSSREDTRKNKKGQSPRGNLARGAGVGYLTGGVPGGAVGGINASRARKAGVVYRKRDAAKDGGVTTAGSVAGAVAGAGSAALTRGKFVNKQLKKEGLTKVRGTVTDTLYDDYKKYRIGLKADRRMLRRAIKGGLVGTVAGGALALRNGKKRVADEKARKNA